MPYSSGGRPATALSPMFGISLPSYTQTSLPSSWRIDVRRDVAPARREMALEHVRRLDDVVVDAHQDHLVHLHPVTPFERLHLVPGRPRGANDGVGVGSRA